MAIIILNNQGPVSGGGENTFIEGDTVADYTKLFTASTIVLYVVFSSVNDITLTVRKNSIPVTDIELEIPANEKHLHAMFTPLGPGESISFLNITGGSVHFKIYTQ